MKVKDFVTIGVFAVIYFVLMYAIGMMGLIPILFLAWPPTIALLLGVVVMLVLAKVPKKGAMFLFGMIAPLAMFAMGFSPVLVINALIFVGLAELMCSMGKYKSFRMNALGNAFFSCWACGSLMQMIFVKEQYLAMTIKMMGAEYAAALEHLITWPNMIIVYIATFIFGIAGGFLGKAMLKKHFERAGIV
ncbi:MAG: MptD family putative ECF transporter S component [Bacillota bacterium]|nr:MptD family putative ECF transporter S component [Bacillota bacterium]